MEGIAGQLYLLIGSFQGEESLSSIFLTGDSAKTGSRAPMEDRLLSLHRDREVGVPSSLMIMFQRNGSQVEKIIPPGICKTGKRC